MNFSFFFHLLQSILVCLLLQDTPVWTSHISKGSPAAQGRQPHPGQHMSKEVSRRAEGAEDRLWAPGLPTPALVLGPWGVLKPFIEAQLLK